MNMAWLQWCFSSFTTSCSAIEHELFLYSVAAAVLLLALLVFLYRSSSSFSKKWRLPPLAGNGMGANIGERSSRRAPWWILELAKQTPGGVFRISMPQINPFVSVANPSVARMILLAPGSDKPQHVYSVFNGISSDIPSVFSRRTDDPKWHPQRKGVAPAFSPKRVNDALGSGKTRASIAELCALLDELAARDEPFDPAVLMNQLTVDIMGHIAMGGFEFNTLKAARSKYCDCSSSSSGSSNSVGQQMLSDMSAALTEFALKRPINPLRQYAAPLLKEAREAKEVLVTQRVGEAGGARVAEPVPQ